MGFRHDDFASKLLSSRRWAWRRSSPKLVPTALLAIQGIPQLRRLMSSHLAWAILRVPRLLQHFGVETLVDFALVGRVTIGLERGDQSAQSWR